MKGMEVKTLEPSNSLFYGYTEHRRTYSPSWKVSIKMFPRLSTITSSVVAIIGPRGRADKAETRIILVHGFSVKPLRRIRGYVIGDFLGNERVAYVIDPQPRMEIAAVNPVISVFKVRVVMRLMQVMRPERPGTAYPAIIKVLVGEPLRHLGIGENRDKRGIGRIGDIYHPEQSHRRRRPSFHYLLGKQREPFALAGHHRVGTLGKRHDRMTPGAA